MQERAARTDAEVNSRKPQTERSSVANTTAIPLKDSTAPVNPMRKYSATTEQAQTTRVAKDPAWDKGWNQAWEQQKREREILSLIKEGKDEIEKLLAIAANGKNALIHT